MTTRTTPMLVALLTVTALLAMSFCAFAEQVARESDIVDLRLGQRILVDDGSCPAGQILEVAGSTLNANGVTRVKKCIPRAGTKKK
jgi:hypothetical protein